MFNYLLINNHYVVNIDEKNYIIDTGSPFSFVRDGSPLVINNEKFYPNRGMSEQVYKSISEFVGMNIDGLIGSDIITHTSLTIYKNGQLEFAPIESEGHQLPIHLYGPYSFIPCVLESGDKNLILVDTGAKYGYGDFFKYFSNDKYLRDIDDYNPTLGYFTSKSYEVKININNKIYKMELGDHEQVTNWSLRPTNSAAVINITQLFDKYCVFDYNKRMLIYK